MWPEMKRILSSFDWTEIANFDGTLRVILAVLLILLSVLIKKYILIPPTVKITKSCKSKVKCGEQISLVGNIKSTFSPILSKAWKTPSKRHSPEILNAAKLMIMQSTFEDSGNYELRVSNFFGSTFQNEYLLVGDKPFIRCEKNELRVLYGGSAKLKVSIDSRPPTLSRRWYMDRDRKRKQVEFPSEFRTFNWQRKKKYTNMVNKNDDTLLIADCCVLDEGIYYFEASNDFGVSKSANVKLCVEKAPPHVTIEDKSWSRKGLHFVGTVISNSAIKSVSWQKKTYGSFEEIDISDERYKGSNTHSSNPTLIVTNLTVEDDAIYRIHVKNVAGEATSDEYRFEVKNAHPLLTISDEDDNDLHTKLQLQIRSNKHIKSITWLKILDENDRRVIQQWQNTKTGYTASCFPCKTIREEGCSLVLKDLSKDKARYQVHVCTVDYTETKNNFLEIAPPRIVTQVVRTSKGLHIVGTIFSNLAIKTIFWQKTYEGVFKDIDISEERYQGSDTKTKSPILRVENVTVEDDAFYRLYARNAAGETTSEGNRFVVGNVEPLLVIVGPHKIDLGEDAKLKLIIRSNKLIQKIQWIKLQDEDRTEIKLWENQNPELDPEYTFPCKTIEENGCYLELKEVTMKDDAKYEAVVHTVDGKTTSTECKLMVLKAPPRVKVFTDGSESTIKANIKSNEEVQLLTWQRMYHGSFQDIDIMHRKYIGSTLDKENPKLEIQDLTAEDDTLYRLIVKNTSGECTSNEVHLALKDAVPLLTINGPYQVDSGDNVTLTLIIRSNKPILKIQWLKLQDENKTEIKLWENQKPELDPESTFPCKTIEENGCYLELKEVTMKDDAKYEAVVQTADGKTTSTQFRLTILKAIAEIILPEDVEVCYGGKASISVTFRTNSPVQRIEWMKAFHDNFTSINILCDKYNQSGYDSSGAVLLVQDCDVLDDAYYRITVYNGFGKSTSRNTHLRVLNAPPSVMLSILDTPILQETVRILARIHGNRPLSKITWHKYLQGVCKITESKLSDYQTYYSTTEESEEYLLIRKVNINDQGLYHVEVSHFTGKAQSNTVRFVLENVPPFIVGITGPTPLDNGNSECAAYFVSSQPLKSITWKHIGKDQDKEISPLDIRYKISTDYSTYSKLIVKEECYIDYAQYLCEITNSVGTTKSHTVHISYENYLQLQIEEPSKTFSAGETAVLIATMNSAPNTTKLWTKSSKDNKTETKLPVFSEYSGKYKGSTSDDERSALCINFLNSDDEGFYQLTVSKKSGHCARSKKVWLGIEKKVSVDEVKMKKGNTFGDCQICLDKENEVVLNPCGHMCCHNCASNLNLCPFCRKRLKGRIKVYKS